MTGGVKTYYPAFAESQGVIAIGCDVEETTGEKINGKKITWLDECDQAKIPIVLIHDNISEVKLVGKGRVSALWEELGALENLVKHLIEDHGCKQLRIVANDPSVRPFRQRKINTIINTAKAHGVIIRNFDHVFIASKDTSEEGNLLARVRIVGDRTVDGVVCLSDELALGVIRALHGTEKENLIVTGYDDLSTAEHFGITSISQERAVRAKWAVDEILAAETRELTDYPSCYRMPSILKCRRSCGCTEGGTTHVCPESPE